ncbi:MAG: phage holin family protein [Akkermansiaceae bacterium]|nr:phage holin family protein [Akkermansiaceae bacterium]
MASKSAFSKTSLEASQRDMDLDTSIDEPSLGETSSQMKSSLSSFVAARIELASIEAKEAAQFAASKAVQGIILGISVFFFWTLVLAGLTGVLAPVADNWLKDKADWLPGWAAVLFALAVIHAIVAVVILICLKKKPASPLFELSRQELENDKQWLKQNK